MHSYMDYDFTNFLFTILWLPFVKLNQSENEANLVILSLIMNYIKYQIQVSIQCYPFFLFQSCLTRVLY